MNKIAIFSVPRSGSSWLGQIFNSHPKVIYKFQPNFAYSFNWSLRENSTKQEIEEFFKELNITEDKFVNAEITISTKDGLKFNKKHTDTLVFKETHYINILENLLKKSDSKIIGLIRSPFAVINSWIKIPKEFDPEWNLAEEWKFAHLKNENKNYNFFGFEKWKEATTLFLKMESKYPERFKVLNYSNLLSSKEKEIKELFDFCDLDYHAQTKKFLNYSNTVDDKDSYSVLKKKFNDDNWKTDLPQFIISEIKRDKKFQELNKIFKWI